MARFISWDELLRVLKALGFTQERPGSNGGSAVPFSLPDGTRRSFHKPHNGAVIRARTMAKRLGIPETRLWELAE